MYYTFTHLPPIMLVGRTVRTNNVAQLDPKTATIGALVHDYDRNGWAGRILHRQHPKRTFSVFTDYASDFNGDYTYLVGEEVTSFDHVAEGLSTLTIPAQEYIRFTDGPGPMPAVCIQMWQKIWKMTDAELGGTRRYVADFEIYDKRAADPLRTTLDIYVGISRK